MAAPALLILAAGLGRRYGGLKQLDGVGPSGETLLDYALFDAVRAGFGKAVFVIRPEMESSFREAILPRLEGRIEVALAFQRSDDLPGDHRPPADRTKPWGTAHAVWSARDVIAEPFAVINADDFYGRDPYAQLVAHFAKAAADEELPPFALVGYPLARTLSPHGAVSRGICVTDAKGKLERIDERTHIRLTDGGPLAQDEAGRDLPLHPATVTSMNFFGFTPALFPLLEASLTRFLAHHAHDPEAECYLPAVVTEAIHAGVAAVRVLTTGAPWMGITYPDDRPAVVARLAELTTAGDYPSPLWS